MIFTNRLHCILDYKGTWNSQENNECDYCHTQSGTGLLPYECIYCIYDRTQKHLLTFLFNLKSKSYQFCTAKIFNMQSSKTLFKCWFWFSRSGVRSETPFLITSTLMLMCLIHDPYLRGKGTTTKICPFFAFVSRNEFYTN